MKFFRKKPDDDDDAQFSKLDELTGSKDDSLIERMKRALERNDLTPEDRREFEDAIRRLKEHPPD